MTTLTLDLHDLLPDALGGETLHVPCTIDVREILDFNDTHKLEIDLDRLLAENRMIAALWTVGHVRKVRPDLDDDMAWRVLQTCSQRNDGNYRITFVDLEQAAYDLFGSGPHHRAERCNRAIRQYGDDLAESNLIDWLADSMHWCKANGHAFDEMLATARTHFNCETQGE